MAQLKDNGVYEITAEELEKIRETFDGGFADEETSVEAMYGVFEDAGYTMDPHTGCAMKVAIDWFEKHKKTKRRWLSFLLQTPTNSRRTSYMR